MIGLRRTIERGMRHRWLGPILVVLVVLLLALLYVHSLHDGHADANLGEFCIGITMMLGIVLLVRVRFRSPQQVVLRRASRAPPRFHSAPAAACSVVALADPPLRL